MELRTVANAAVLETQDLRFNESLEWSQRAIELARETVNPFAEAQARLMASLASSYMGNLEGLREQLEAFLQMMENTQDRTGLSQALFCNEVASWMAGDWQLARGFNDRGLELTPAAPHQNLTRTVMEYELGNFEGGAASLDRYLELMGRRPPGPNIFYAGALLLTALASRISGDSHRLEEAEAAADVVLRSPIATPRYVSFARFGKGLLAVLRHDISSARVEYEALLPGKGRYDAWMSLDRLLGLLSQTLGNVDQAVTHFEDVLTFNRKEGLRPDLAWTCCDYADLLLERNNEGDRAKSTSLLDESLAISSELGMRALMERVLSRREILGA